MNKKILFYALVINIITSFLGALAYKYLCDNNKISCGDVVNENHLDVFVPTVIAGTIFIIIAYFISKWTKLQILFFLIPFLLAAMFNIGGEESLSIKKVFTAFVMGILPVFIATYIAWLLTKEKTTGA